MRQFIKTEMLKSEVSATDKFLQPKIFILEGKGFLSSPCAVVKSCSEPVF